MTHIILPHAWSCRPYQVPAWRYMDGGGKRAALKWHRRSGKDNIAIHWTTVASQRRVGVYWHMLPTLRQGRKVVWENIGADGRRILDAWPGWQTPGAVDKNGEPVGLVKHLRNDEMKLELWNGSIWYVVGSDNYDAAVGSNPVGIVMSEWALSDPAAWNFLSPILAENDGWAMFVWTPRGRNHAARMFAMARENPLWFAQALTVDDTTRDDGSPVITAAAIAEERNRGMAEEVLMQEYYVSEDAPLVGSFWGEQLIKAEKDKRICPVAHDPAIKVFTWWDLGHSDATAIWFLQIVGNEIHLIDYYEANGEPLEHYAFVLETLRKERKWIYGRHIWPHDGGAKSLASKGRKLNEMFADLDYLAEVQPRHDPEVAIQRVRQILPRCWFDNAYRIPDENRILSPSGKRGVEYGLDALRAFRKKLDEDRSTEDRPYYLPGYVHDWSSHGASAFYTGAMTIYDANSARVVPTGDRYSGRSKRKVSHWAS